MIGRCFFMFIGTFFSIMPAIIYLIAGWLIIRDPLHAGISLGGIVAFTTLQSRIFFPIGQLLSIQVEIQGALALFDRIFEYLDIPIEIHDSPGALRLDPDKARGEITFKNVTFAYKRDEPAVLSGLNDKQDVENRNGKSKRAGSPNPIAFSDQPVAATAINDVSFQITPEQIAALVGPRGACNTPIT